MAYHPSNGSLRSTGRLALLALTVWLTAVSCATEGGQMREPVGVTVVPSGGAESSGPIGQVAALDFYELRVPVNGPEPRICPLTGFAFTPGEVETGSGETMADLFRVELAERGVQVADRDATRAAMGAMPATAGEYNLALGARTAIAAGAQAALMGVVIRFEELQGTKISADRPASVAFSAALVSAKGELLWKAKFEKTQKPLFTNLLDFRTFFKGGMVWQRAATLANIGVDGVLARALLTERGAAR